MPSDLRIQLAREKMRQAGASVKVFVRTCPCDPKKYADLLVAARQALKEYLILVDSDSKCDGTLAKSETLRYR